MSLYRAFSEHAENARYGLFPTLMCLVPVYIHIHTRHVRSQFAHAEALLVPPTTTPIAATSTTKPKPVIRRPRSSPVLDEVAEIEEAEMDMRDKESDPIDAYTTDDDKEPPVDVPTQIVASPPRTRGPKTSKKRDRAPTMSSTSSKDGKAPENLHKQAATTTRTSSEPLEPPSISILC